MREFMQKHSYSAVRLFVNQIAISIFGLVLAIACGKVENETLKVVASLGAILAVELYCNLDRVCGIVLLLRLVVGHIISP